jgi:hypothetical protein
MPDMNDDADRKGVEGASVLVAGAGNIGSHLAPLLLRAGVGALTLVDRDRVEGKNLTAQDYRPPDVGRFKAEVQAERLRALFPGRRVAARSCDLEDLPLGVAGVDVILGALDSRRARQVLVSEVAWALGVPVIDGGVGDGWLGRVQVFVPGPASACLECTWGRADYRLLSAEYPCVPGAAPEAPPTRAPAFLGSLVAALMSAECLRLLDEGATESYEIALDLNNHQMRHYALRRARGCRHDHAVVRESLPLAAQATVGELLDAVQRRCGTAPVRLACRRLISATRYLTLEALRPRRAETLAALGFAPGDRVRVRGGDADMFLTLTGEPGA